MCGLLGFEFESVSAGGKRNQGFWRVSWSGQRKARIRPGVDALGGVRSWTLQLEGKDVQKPYGRRLYGPG